MEWRFWFVGPAETAEYYVRAYVIILLLECNLPVGKNNLNYMK